MGAYDPVDLVIDSALFWGLSQSPAQPVHSHHPVSLLDRDVERWSSPSVDHQVPSDVVLELFELLSSLVGKNGV